MLFTLSEGDPAKLPQLRLLPRYTLFDYYYLTSVKRLNEMYELIAQLQYQAGYTDKMDL